MAATRSAPVELRGPAPFVRVHLHVAVLDEVDDAAARARCDSWLSAQERERRDHLVFEENRREFVYAHGLLRLALSRQAPAVAPNAWRFSVGAHGRPAIEGPAGAPALHFNLSHTRGLVACAVGREPLLGVDVEAIDRTAASTRIAERFFAPSEVDALRRLPPEEQRERFFRFWTLKESYIKATGLGLSVPLDQFWFALTPSEPVAIEFGARITDDGSRWRFAERQPTPRHRLAVAVGADREGDWTIDLVEEALDPLVFRRLGRGA